MRCDKLLFMTVRLFALTVGCTASTRPREYTAREGTITSPNYSAAYNENANCVWTITVDEDNVMCITVYTLTVSLQVLKLRGAGRNHPPKL